MVLLNKFLRILIFDTRTPIPYRDVYFWSRERAVLYTVSPETFYLRRRKRRRVYIRICIAALFASYQLRNQLPFPLPVQKTSKVYQSLFTYQSFASKLSIFDAMANNLAHNTLKNKTKYVDASVYRFRLKFSSASSNIEKDNVCHGRCYVCAQAKQRGLSMIHAWTVKLISCTYMIHTLTSASIRAVQRFSRFLHIAKIISSQRSLDWNFLSNNYRKRDGSLLN